MLLFNLQTKTRIGTYSYDGDKLNAVEETGNPAGDISLEPQHIDYTLFNKVSKITEDNYELNIFYGPDQQRKQSILKTIATGLEKRNIIYSGNYEKIVADGNTYEVTYLPTGAINVRNSGVDQLYYVFTDHLGNVMVVVSDRRLPVDDGTYVGGVKQNSTPDGITDFYTADVVQAVDRYPGGWPMPGRTFFGAEKYRFGAGGHENIDELTNSESTVDMGDRWLDLRTLRTPKPDRKAQKYPSLSPYSYAANNPIFYLDQDGKEIKGFSVDQKGNILMDAKAASKDAMTIYSAMSKTGMGTEAFKAMIKIPTKVTIIISSEKNSDAMADTDGKGKIKEGDQTYYKKATMTFYAEAIGDKNGRYEGDLQEGYNATGVHERWHLDPGQIQNDNIARQLLSKEAMFQAERLPYSAEFSAQEQYRETYKPGSNELFKIPYLRSTDLDGISKPSYFGVDDNNQPLPMGKMQSIQPSEIEVH